MSDDVPPARLVLRIGRDVGGAIRELREVGDLVLPARLGRDASCEIRLDDPAVSGAHAVLSREPSSGLRLADGGSTNGTWVGGVRVGRNAIRLLGEGDLLQIGPFTIQVTGIRGDEPSGDAGDASMGTADLALHMLHAGHVRAVASVRIVEGGGSGTRLDLLDVDRPYTIGRGDEASLVVPDRRTSREHVTITRRGRRTFLRDNASKNGALLGGDRMPSDVEVLWPPALHLRIGDTVLSLDPAADDDDDERPALTTRSAPLPLRTLPESEVTPPSSASSASRSAGDSPDAPVAQLPEATPGPPPAPRRRAPPVLPAVVAGAALLLALCLAGLTWIMTAHP